MRRHATRVLTLEFRAKRVGTESNPDAPVYVKVVETTAPTDAVEVELTLPAGAYTVQAKANHWLRGEVAVVSSVSWIFAAPTGANKVTMYWDEVAGATGYRVRWGTVSGSYPHSSAVLPAAARQWSITGLVTEQTYYVVVQAEYNGLWGPPSEEDSAVPHVGAIPWDSENPSAIMASVRAITGAGWGQLEVVSPNGVVYSDLGSSPPYAFTQEGTDIVTYSDGTWGPLLKDSEELENTKTGPYRRVREHGDAPCVYFGFAYANMDVEAGVMFQPAWRPEDWQGARHDRWQVFFHYRKTGQLKPERLPVLGSPTNPRHHILVLHGRMEQASWYDAGAALPPRLFHRADGVEYRRTAENWIRSNGQPRRYNWGRIQSCVSCDNRPTSAGVSLALSRRLDGVSNRPGGLVSARGTACGDSSERDTAIREGDLEY
jgi:hypothetical protein